MFPCANARNDLFHLRSPVKFSYDWLLNLRLKCEKRVLTQSSSSHERGGKWRGEAYERICPRIRRAPWKIMAHLNLQEIYEHLLCSRKLGGGNLSKDPID